MMKRIIENLPEIITNLSLCLTYPPDSTRNFPSFNPDSKIQQMPERLGLDERSRDSSMFASMDWELIEEEGPSSIVEALDGSLDSNSVWPSSDSCAAMVDDLLKMESGVSPSSANSGSQECTASFIALETFGSPQPSLSEISGLPLSEGSNPCAKRKASLALPAKKEEESVECCDILTRVDVNDNFRLSGSSHKRKASSGACKRSNQQIMEGDPDVHILTERERRKKMRTMFTTLQSLLDLPKADKTAIVEAAISRIKELQETKEMLLMQKSGRLPTNASSGLRNSLTMRGNQDRPLAPEDYLVIEPPRKTWCSDAPVATSAQYAYEKWESSNVVLNMCGSDGLFNICIRRNSALLSAIFFPLLKNNLEVVNAQISSTDDKSFYSIHAQALGDSPTASESFNMAYQDLMFWLSSSRIPPLDFHPRLMMGFE